VAPAIAKRIKPGFKRNDLLPEQRVRLPSFKLLQPVQRVLNPFRDNGWHMFVVWFVWADGFVQGHVVGQFV
jgi:hypothetical protein